MVFLQKGFGWAILPSLILLPGCFKTDFMKQSDSESENISVSALSQEEGLYKAAFVAELHRDQTLLVSDSEIGEAEITIPGGALAVAMNISVQEGVNLATQSLQSDLSLAEDIAVSHSGRAINIMGDANADLIEPMTIAINLPAVGSLNLNDSQLYPTVLYHVVRHGEGGTARKGVFGSNEITIKGNQVVFATRYFGTFQAVYLNKPIESKVDILVQEEILSKREEGKLPEVVWSILTPSLEAQTFIVTAALEGNRELSRCALFLDDDKSLPWLYADSVDSPGVHKIVIEKSWQGMQLFASFECFEKNGRVLRSAWSASVAVPNTTAASAAEENQSSQSDSDSQSPSVDEPSNPPEDTTQLNAAFSINSQQSFTTTANVILTLLDAASVTHFRVANGISANCSAATWDIYQGVIAHQLTAGDGSKTVCLQVKNSAGFESAIEVDTIILDSMPPATSTFAINSGMTYTNSLLVSISLDSTLGVAEFRLANGTDCAAASWQPFISANLSHTLLSTDGQKTVCLQVRDEAGNLSSTMTAGIILDQDAPILTLLQASAYLEASTSAGPNTDFSLTVSDSTAGVQSVEYTVYDAAQQKYFDGSSFAALSAMWLSAAGSGSSRSFSVPDSSFSVGADYSVSIRASDAAQNYGFDDYTFTWITRPETPASLSIAYEHGGLSLAWTPTSTPGQNIEGYLLVRRQGTPVVGEPIDGIDYLEGETLSDGSSVIYVGNGHSFSDSPLTENLQYYYALFAMDSIAVYSTAKIGDAVARKTIYRSVEVGATTALATGASNSLTVVDSVATFASVLPDSIGVGDALEYDFNNSGLVNSIVFITKRISSTEFLVKDNLGQAATNTSTADIDWKIYRAYTSLFDAENGNENPNIFTSLRNFDTWTGGRNISANAEIWHIAVYKSTNADIQRVVFQDWTTSETFYLRLFSPQSIGDVGENQRHQGVYSADHYRLEAPGVSSGALLMFTGYANHARVEGLQLYLNEVVGSGNATLSLRPDGMHHYQVEGNIIKGSPADTIEVGNVGVEIWDYNANSPNGKIVLVNNIIYDFTNVAGGGQSKNAICIGLWSNNTSAVILNNTILNCSDNGILRDAVVVPTPVSKNNIILQTNLAMSPSTGSFLEASNVVGSAPSFVDSANDNFLLDPADTVATNGHNLAGNTDFPFFFDILGNPRGFGPWAIGAHQPQ